MIKRDITGSGESYTMEKSQFRNFLRPPPPPEDKVKLFEAPLFKEWKRFAPSPPPFQFG